MKAEQRDAAQAVVSGVLGDGVLPATDPSAFTVKVTDAAAAADVLAGAGAREHRAHRLRARAPSLDDVFFALTGRPAEDKADDKPQDKTDGKPDGKPRHKHKPDDKPAEAVKAVAP